MTNDLTFEVSNGPASLSVVLGSTMDHIDRVDTLVKHMLWENGLEKHSFAVRVVMREGLTNSVRHGNKHDPGKLIRFDIRITGHTLTMVIEDQGEGFDWRAIQTGKSPDKSHEKPSDHGRGFLIMGDYFDACGFNEKGNILILEKNISA
jgi:serine/threonine-protein kinase RsbW